MTLYLCLKCNISEPQSACQLWKLLNITECRLSSLNNWSCPRSSFWLFWGSFLLWTDKRSSHFPVFEENYPVWTLLVLARGLLWHFIVIVVSLVRSLLLCHCIDLSVSSANTFCLQLLLVLVCRVFYWLTFNPNRLHVSLSREQATFIYCNATQGIIQPLSC